MSKIIVELSIAISRVLESVFIFNRATTQKINGHLKSPLSLRI